VNNHRLDRFYELDERYGGSRVILFINEKSDNRSWIINFTLWLSFKILPDLPEIITTGTVIAIIYGLAWALEMTLCGGGILGVLAFIGGKLGSIPGIPPAIAGILFFCGMFVVFINLLRLAF
jgi:hypothetical protein